MVFAGDEKSECVLDAAMIEVDGNVDDVVVFGVAASGVYTR